MSFYAKASKDEAKVRKMQEMAKSLLFDTQGAHKPKDMLAKKEGKKEVW